MIEGGIVRDIAISSTGYYACYFWGQLYKFNPDTTFGWARDYGTYMKSMDISQDGSFIIAQVNDDIVPTDNYVRVVKINTTDGIPLVI